VAVLVKRARELAEVPERIVKDLTHYTKDPQVLLRARAQVSELILALQEVIGKKRAAAYRSRHIQQRKELERKSLERNIRKARRQMK